MPGWLFPQRASDDRMRRARRATLLRLEALEGRALLASFQAIPSGTSPVEAVSADGNVVVGFGFHWSSGEGLVPLVAPQGLSGIPAAKAVSADGSVIVGEITPNFGAVPAFRWSPGQANVQTLPVGSLYADAYGVSSNGNTIVGYASSFDANANGVYRLSGGQASTVIPTNNTFTRYQVAGISSSASVIAGTGFERDGSSTIFRWANNSFTTLPEPLARSSFATAVSPDGSVIVGTRTIGFLQQAIRWTPQGVSDLGSRSSDATPNGVSANGSIIVGDLNPSGNAFIWDQDQGIRDLKTVLVNEHGLGPSLQGWILGTATAITPDGLTIVGQGVDPQNRPAGWIVRLDASIENPSAEISINGTVSKTDNITLFNPAVTGQPYAQPIHAIITNTGNATATFQLSVSAAGAATVSQNSVTLAAGESSEVQVTPKAVSAAPYDTQIIVSHGSTEIARDVLTIVSVLIPQRIRSTNTPYSMKDRIPPRVGTPFNITVAPDLTGSGQSVTLAVNGQSASNGMVTIDGEGTKYIAKTGKVSLSSPDGSTQTAATGQYRGSIGIRVGENGSKLKLVVGVRGQDTTQSHGFSVAAIPVNFSNTRKLVQPRVRENVALKSAGMQVYWHFESDSGVLGDLDAVEVSEVVQAGPGTGGLAINGFARTSGYNSARDSLTFYDTHSVAFPYFSNLYPDWNTGEISFDQLFKFRDRRTGSAEVPMANSGFRIVQRLYIDPVDGKQKLHTVKRGASIRINSLYSEAGTVEGGEITRTQEV
ncbi:hypothetical protein [Paludisphaera sp.]|uniref:hypothetical protein n=1 Tax=Paludisphaera sp. TaxID=2017432 RepID=UPI00301B7C70